MSDLPRVAVVGIGGLFPGAATPADLFASVLACRDESREPPPGRWAVPVEIAHAPGEPAPDRVTSRRACFLDSIPGEGGRLDPLFHLALAISRQAWASARMEGVDRNRVGVILGCLALPTERASALARHVILGKGPEQDPLNRHATGVPAALVAQDLGLGGTILTLDAACASSLYAIKLAVDELQAGRADAMLAGGLSRPDSLYTQMGFSQLRALSPTGHSSPFDARGDGLLVGEGGGAFVLKRLEDAERAGDKIWGVLAGIGLSNDLAGGLLAPASEGQLRAMRAAYEQAGWSPADVQLIECHATGTPVGDAVEFRSMCELWEGQKGRCVIGSVKSTVGHLLTGAGAAALTKVLLAMEAGVLPPTSNHERPTPGLGMENSPFRVLQRAEPWPTGPRRAAVSGFGFGGINAHVLVEAHRSAAPRDASPRSSAASLTPGSPSSRIAIHGAAVVTGDARLPIGRFKIPPREVEAMLAQQSLLLLAADEAAREAGWQGGPRAGAFIGAALDASTTDFHLRWVDGADVPPLTADRTMGALASIAASRLAREFRIGGPCITVSDGDLAVQLAADALRRGELDWVMAGAVDRADDPRDGGTGGRAAAVVILRRQEDGSACLAMLDEIHSLQLKNFGIASGPVALAQACRPKHGGIAFVYPGSGNDFPGMAREIAEQWPAFAEGLPLASGPTMNHRLMAQVAVGCLVTDVLRSQGIEPTAAIGYSLGESAALFALRAWTDREGMASRMAASSLFVSDLCGRCDAAGRTWGVEAVRWATAIVDRPADEMRLPERVYLQFVNGPRECVIGGDAAAVASVPGARIVPTTTTMHCCVVDAVAPQYRALHRLPTTPPPGVRFYSSGLGRAYVVTPDSAADAILAQARATVDFPAVIEAAYADGVRTFIEVGPGASCTRLISQILAGRPHLVIPVCVAGPDGLAGLRSVLEAVAPGGSMSETGDLSNEVSVLAAAHAARIDAHAAYLRHATTLQETMARAVMWLHQIDPARPFQLEGGTSSERGLPKDVASEPGGPAAFRSPANLPQPTTLMPPPPSDSESRAGGEPHRIPAFDRPACLTFAVGRIGDVLGAAYSEIDSFPTRVRLPDEPLMLVDRIVSVEGEPLSLSHGRVVTEHDILPGAWYLDKGRIPTCLAVESGQADLFLSGYLGIDLRTRGRAMYRLLDAAVTFHRELPGPGAVIRYDIHIDSFFRQDETHLFRFRFVGSVDGEPLLTMSDGIAGFFTEEVIAAGKGVVKTAMQRKPLPARLPEGEQFLPPMRREAYSEEQVDALRHGDLAACFGEAFHELPLRAPMRLPGGRMRLVHRVTEIDPTGGRFGAGLIRAEADIRPDDWFLTCHFIDDQVMPGTLMYECCLHTLRIFLMRLGWVGEQDEVACEPVPGVSSRLKCRGQVTAQTRTVTYEVVIKERGYHPEPYAIVDALMYADGKPIVDIGDMSIRLSGLTREKIEQTWDSPHSPPGSQVAFTSEQILAYAIGKPSEAFGPGYAAFDSRFLARLPGPPFLFVDRITRVETAPFIMKAGGSVTAQYDVPPDAWYFAENRAPVMPFCVLLEAALQVCGWTSAYIGSALTSSTPLHYRNLGGKAEILRDVTPSTGTLTTTVNVTRVASSGGMIIQDFDFDLRDAAGSVYKGSTTFGFFSPEALAQQVGIRDSAPVDAAGGEAVCYPEEHPFPGTMLRMMDRITCQNPGLIEGHKTIRPEEWFFKAHFYQDPVWPGSLGLEALVQLLEVVAVREFGPGEGFAVNHGPHKWIYRGQVLPTNREVQVQGAITGLDALRKEVRGDGWLTVDGRTIYRMEGFTVRKK